MPSHVFNALQVLSRALPRAMCAVACSYALRGPAATLDDVERRTGLAVCEMTDTSCVLTNDDGRMVFSPGSRRFEYNRRSIWLNSPAVADSRSGLTFDYTDMAKMICPLVAAPVSSTNTDLCIQLDAGHGGEDGGCVSTHNRMQEKDIVLDVVLRAGEMLEDRGFTVVYSRTDDTFVTLSGRSALASVREADAFVSVHANFAVNHTARGAETFTLSFANAESTSSERSVGTGARIGNANDLRNTLLGYFIHRRLPGRVGEADRGLRHARFQVLRDTPCPAALVEIGFLSNVNDSRNLASDWYRDRLAMAIADGIAEFATYIPRKPDAADGRQTAMGIATNAPDVAVAVAVTNGVPGITVSTNAVERADLGSVATNEADRVSSATNAVAAPGAVTNAPEMPAPLTSTGSAMRAMSVTNLPADTVGTNAASSSNAMSDTNAAPSPTSASGTSGIIGKDMTNAVVVPR